MAVPWASVGVLAATLIACIFYLGGRIDALGDRIDAQGARLDGRMDALAADLGEGSTR
jgi:hypothetical protein